MGFLSDLNRKRKKVQKKILNPVVKGFSKISDKLIPNELRFLAPYAAGIGSLMLPPGIGPAMRGLYAAGLNAAGQVAADETPIEDISDLNALSMALAGGLGALGSDSVSGSMRGGVETGGAGTSAREAAIMKGAGVEPPPVGFLQGAENVGREGIASLSDMVTGGRQTLADIGKNPGSLFSSANKFKTATDAAGALGPTLTLGTGDVAYEAAIDAQNLFEENEAEELRQAGMSEEAIANARRSAIRSSMLAAQFTEDEILNTLDQVGLKNGGIASLKDGGMLNFGGREMDLRSGGFVPIGKKERADDVPARLSKNEFVMTADAVRAAGGGSVNKGAQRMYDIMNRLEARA